MKIGILDLKVVNFSRSSYYSPSMYTMLASGFHKAKGDQVKLITSIYNYRAYDIIYIVNDSSNLDYDPVWAGYPGVRLVGNYWNEEERYYDEQWERYPPDKNIYKGWIEEWISKNKNLKKKRFEIFEKTPVKIKRCGKIYSPEGDNLLIIDDDIHEWDPEYKHILSLNLKKAHFLYPQRLNNRWEPMLKLFNANPLVDRANFSCAYYGLMPREEADEAIRLLFKYKTSRFFIVRNHLYAESEEEWLELIPKAIDIFCRFYTIHRRRLFLYFENIKSSPFPELLTSIKRWSVTVAVLDKNTPFDYILTDTFKDYYRILNFLQDPLHNLNANMQWFVKIFRDYPQLIDSIMQNPRRWEE